MKYTEAPDKASELIDAIENQLAIERAEHTDERPHVSDLLYCLRASWRKHQMQMIDGVSTPIYAREVEDENRRLILLIGQALHTIVAKALGREANKRLESDWLVGEADARLLEDGTIEEFKTARAGFTLDDPIKWPHYVEQVASYIVLSRGMGFRTLKAILHVLHLTFNSGPRWYDPHPKQLKRESNEEYADRLSAVKRQARIDYEQKVAEWVLEEGRHSNLRSWPIDFSEYEIETWEKELRRRAAIWADTEEPSVDENVPADKTGYSWTCAYCPFNIKRGGDCSGGSGRLSGFFPADRVGPVGEEVKYSDEQEVEDVQEG